MAKYVLKSKYHNTQEEWLEVYKNISSYVSREEIEEKINTTITEIKKVIERKNVAYAWSGGKDSLALQIIMEKLNINKGIVAISKELEYTSFLEYIYKNVPKGIEIKDIPVKFEYLNKHPELLFPQESLNMSKWYRMIQHTAQNKYIKENNIDILILGRRNQDGNYTGKNNVYSKKNQSTVIYSPLADWKHEDILAVLYYYGIKLPDIYYMENGFNTGTHNIFARMGDKRKNLEEVYKYDKKLLEKLAPHINLVKEFINEK